MASKPAPTAKKPVKKAALAAAPKKAAAPAAPAKKAAAGETIALKAVFEQLAESQNLPKKQAHALLAGMVETVIAHLKNGNRIRMNGLGILEVKDREARTGRNPATGETIQIAASKKVAFRASKDLKDVV
jgi:DNA-binding protein HU-beta